MSDSDLEELPAGLTPFYAEMGRMTLEWNRTENSMRRLLVALCDLPVASGYIKTGIILTAGLGNVTMGQAIDALAKDVLGDPIADAAKHAAVYFNTIREYRNHYTHDIRDVLPSDGSAVGWTEEVKVNNKIIWRKGYVEIANLRFVSSHCRLLRRYAEALIQHQSWESNNQGWPRPEVPHKPLVPKRLRAQDKPPQ